MLTASDLREKTESIDHRGYPAYKELQGAWRFPKYILSVDHVQGDPFAAPSRLSIRMTAEEAGFPADFRKTKERRRALEDLLLRRFSAEVRSFSFRARGSGKSGLIGCSTPGQEILERTACRVNPENGGLTVRFEVGFPANGRSIAARELLKILMEFLPQAAERALVFHKNEASVYRSALELADDQAAIRREIRERGLAAFVADGSVLPRESGISQRPMKGAVRFVSPETMRVTLQLPHAGAMSGMGIPEGITLIVGGGYHGKSTLLEALERGVYNHIAGDGREYVITDDTAVKLRAEDGRSIRKDDISLFINNLPGGGDCTAFSSENASGSTSQAANTVEAMEAGSRVFLIDEDTCATNFMIRDDLMARVVKRADEPITPFSERIRPLYERQGISTILVAGSSGMFFRAADHVIQMDRYRPLDITERVRGVLREAQEAFAEREADAAAPEEREAAAGREAADAAREGQPVSQGEDSRIPEFRVPGFRRIPKPSDLQEERGRRGEGRHAGGHYGGRRPEREGSEGREESAGGRVKVKVTGRDEFLLGHDAVELGQLEQLVDREQTAALAYLLIYLSRHEFDGKRTLTECVDSVMKMIETRGLESAVPGARAVPDLALPRKAEVMACVNRWRKLVI